MTCFSVDFIGELEISIAGTISEVVVGISLSNDGGIEVVSFDKIKSGSDAGNSKLKSGSLGGDSRFSVVCF